MFVYKHMETVEYVKNKPNSKKKKKTCKIRGYISQDWLGLRTWHFQGMISKWIWTYRETFKSALVSFWTWKIWNKKIIFTLLLFAFFVPCKKARAAVLADPFNSLSIFDLYLAHTLHHIFTINLFPFPQLSFYQAHCLFPTSS